MTILQAVVLGVVQGVTEFLPVSSSGHLLLVPAILGWPEQALAFDVAVHVATLFAVVVALREDIWQVGSRAVKTAGPERSLIVKIIIATIPAALVAFAFGDLLDLARTPLVVGGALIFWGVLLGVMDYFAQGRKPTLIAQTSWRDALLLGAAQALALIPGTSRSGVTVTTGLALGLSRETAARFSFLLAIPAIAGAGVLTAIDSMQNGLDVEVLPLVVGFISAMLSGLLAIRLFLYIAKRASLMSFAVYRVLVGILILWWFM